MITIIYAHPWNGSFNNSIKDSVIQTLEKRNTAYNLIDLYKDKFNPVYSETELSNYSDGLATDPQVIKYQSIISQSKQVIFIFPIWWYHLPAILKGFMDKVFLKHFSWDLGKFGLNGKLTHIEKAIVITTMDTPNWYYKFFMFSPLKHSFIKATLKAVGIKKVKWFSNGSVSSSDEKSRIKFLGKVSNAI